jgi:hypothetical protein
MAAVANRVLVLGLELGDGRLIDAWTRSGQLPVLQSLRQRGCWGWLDTSADLLHISAWPSIYTGTQPGEHGVYFTFQPAPGLQGYQRFHTGLYGQPTLWKLLDAARHRCVVLDPPYAHPEDGFNGTLIYEWGSWAHYLAPGSTPPEAIKQLQQQVGAYPLGLEANDLGWGALDAAGANRATAGDREHVFDRHQERLVDRTLGLRNVFVHRLHQLKDSVMAELRLFAFQELLHLLRG